METFEIEIGGQKLAIEVGRVARQADGSCWVRYGDTVSMVAVCASDKPDHGRGFFPLSVDYRERTYAAGKIPGGFFKREGRPSEKEILSARLIDRPIRPLFPEGYANEVQIMVTVLSHDTENDADILGMIGASASLLMSSIPFTTLLATVRVGRVDGQFVVNPTKSQLAESEFDLIVAGTPEHIVMVEGGCNEVPEDVMVEALAFGHDNIRKICSLLSDVRERVGKPKQDVIPPEIPDGLQAKVNELAKQRIIDTCAAPDKSERHAELMKISTEVNDSLSEEFPECGVFIRQYLEDIEAEDMRGKVLSTSIRVDGRQLDEVRQITCEVGVLPRTHGSALFTRGQTQALAVATLGTKSDEQRLDELDGESTKSYMLHYNFPPYSVGEVRPARGPGRREIGHGALAERAIAPILPVEGDFPYTLRIVSEILESNGSSSMATVCGGILALMDAGVPIKAPVAGIAMGLVMHGDNYKILTDIQGAEDHFGDMDFKVTGTREGITAFQLDIKVGGLTIEIMREALEQAKRARLHILDKMAETIAESRTDISEYAPRIITLKVKQDRIGDIIGPGGKIIRAIIEETGATINIEDDGTVQIGSVQAEAGLRAKQMVLALVEEPEVEKVYNGTVKRITDFGAFVEILPNLDGLLHVSEIAWERINHVEDVMRVGDKIEVKVLSIDGDNKIRLSRKVLLEKPEGYVARDSYDSRDSRPRRPGGDYRRGDNDRDRSRNRR